MNNFRSFKLCSYLIESLCRYDTGQIHIMVNSTFRNFTGTDPIHSIVHGDQYIPQIMQIAAGIVFDNCLPINRRWRFNAYDPAPNGTTSGRLCNWVDADGSISLTGRPTLLGTTWAGTWWRTNASECTLADNSNGMRAVMCDMVPEVAYGSLSVTPDSTVRSCIGATCCGNSWSLHSLATICLTDFLYQYGG